MKIVVKIGGSLIQDPAELNSLINEISWIAQTNKVLIIPGGGILADQVRFLDKKFNLKTESSHWMALLTEDINAILIHEKIRNAILIDELDDFNADSDQLFVFQPTRFVLKRNELPNSWDVTSDSVAAWVASKVKADKLILVKDVDGLYSSDPKKNSSAKFISEINSADLKKWKRISCVDLIFPQILRVPCVIVNGKHPDRLRAIFSGLHTKATHVIP